MGRYKPFALNSKKLKRYKPFGLNPKKNGSGYITSFSLNIGSKEAREAGFVDSNGNPFVLKKQIVDGKLIISRDIPLKKKTDFEYMLDNFDLKGRFKNSETCLNLLYYLEGESEHYKQQLNGLEEYVYFVANGLVYKNDIHKYFCFCDIENNVITGYHRDTSIVADDYDF